jgi:hypothetical protein
MKRTPRLVPVLILLSDFIFLTGFAGPADTTHISRNIVITGVGDIMLGTSFPSVAFLPSHNNPLLLLGDLADTLAASDITFGNLEGSFLNEGEPVKKCRDTTICYLFRMPESYAGALSVAGFDFLRFRTCLAQTYNAAAGFSWNQIWRTT